MDTDTVKEADITLPAQDESTGVEEKSTGPEIGTQIDLENWFNQQRDNSRPGKDTQNDTGPEETEGSYAEHSDQNASEEEHEEAEETEEEVLSNKDRTNKRFKELLGKLDDSQKRLDEALAEVNRLKKGDSEPEETAQQPQSIDQLIAQARTADELRSLQAQAKAAREWALRNLHQEYVEVDGDEKSHDDIVNMQLAAERALSEWIPQRAQVLQQQEAMDRQAHELFPGWNDPDSEQGKFFSNLLQDPMAQDLFNRLPNGKMLFGMLYEGNQVVQRKLKESNAPKRETDQAQEAVQPQRRAPNLPGMRTATTPNRIPQSEKRSRENATKELTKKGPLTQAQLEAFFNQ